MPTVFVDQDRECIDCGERFVFSASEQCFFAEKGFTPPKRCRPCRQLKKAMRDANGRALP